MSTKTYRVYHIATDSKSAFKLIDLTELSSLDKEKVRNSLRPHNYPTVYMSGNEIEPNALFINSIPVELDTLKFVEKTVMDE